MMRQLWHLSMKRFLSTAPNVDKNLLSKLRKQTGIPFINCKKALSKFDNDFDQVNISYRAIYLNLSSTNIFTVL